MPNYTPGPWKAARVYGNNAPDSFKVFTKPFGGVCVADCGDNEENAKIVAAAPELAEIVKEAANMIEYVLDDGYSFEGGKELLEKMRKVIFKIA